MQIVDIIQSMLAPGLMISACGLLALGINNKYSIAINRVRLLESEKRSLEDMSEEKGRNERRLINIRIQINRFQQRLKRIRNVVIFYSVAIALFILSCLTIGIQYLVEKDIISLISLGLFLLGMITVLIGVLLAVKEAIEGYRTVEIELED